MAGTKDVYQRALDAEDMASHIEAEGQRRCRIGWRCLSGHGQELCWGHDGPCQSRGRVSSCGQRGGLMQVAITLAPVRPGPSACAAVVPLTPPVWQCLREVCTLAGCDQRAHPSRLVRLSPGLCAHPAFFFPPIPSSECLFCCVYLYTSLSLSLYPPLGSPSFTLPWILLVPIRFLIFFRLVHQPAGIRSIVSLPFPPRVILFLWRCFAVPRLLQHLYNYRLPHSRKSCHF